MTELHPIQPAATTTSLCAAQEGLWFAQRLDPENPLFNTGQFIELDGPLDLDAFRRAHAAAMAEAEVLRLRIVMQDGEPQQRLDGHLPELEVVDLRNAADGFSRARAAMDRDSARPCDPTCDPLARFVLYRLSDTHHLWYERIHHLAIDGYGMVLVTNRVAALYGERLGRKPAPALAPYHDVIEADLAYRDSKEFIRDREAWLGRCRDLGTAASPNPRAAEVPSAHHFHRIQQDVPAPTVSLLMQRAQDLRLPWPDMLTLLSGAYLRRVSPDGDAIFGLPFMARFGTGAARVPCMWMNVLPHALGLDEDAPLDQALTAGAKQLAAERRIGRYRSEVLRRDLGRTRIEERLYGPLINVQPYDVAPVFDGLDSRLHILNAGPVDDLTVSYRGNGKSGLTLEIDANPALYPLEEVRAHLQRLLAFLSGALQADRLGDVPTLTGPEEGKLVHDLNATDHPVPQTTLSALIENRLLMHPRSEAVRADGASMSYGDLDRRSRALAEALVARGAGKDRIVAVALDRSLDLAVALVAVLRAGAAYVPLDPQQPPERLKALIEQTDAIALLAREDIDCAGAITPYDPDQWPRTPANTPLPRPAPDDLAYVLFTSGSTGAPKGVMIEHRAIVNRLLWMREHYDFSADDRILQKTPTTFDVSVWELFLPYLCGGTLVFADPDAHRDPAQIARLIRREGISVCHFVPSMLAAFLNHPDSEGIRMRQVFCSGEELTPKHRDRFHARIRAELHNLYGPTEAAVDVTFWAADRSDDSAPVPIGHPVWNTRCHILDGALRPVPQGVTGQLYLGGIQLARGYLGRDDLTAERFLPDPFRPGERLYATGDLARYRADGAITYLGRNDHQIKIRGMRVELGEIEHALRELPGIREALVIADDSTGAQQLIGHVLAGKEFDKIAALRRLERHLPAHMIPSDLIRLDSFPTTANGKLDRKALPRPARQDLQGTPAETEMEKQLAALYSDILQLDRIPPREADFFGLGGDSLSAVQLQLELEKTLGQDLSLGQIFETPRIHALARALEDQDAAQGGLGAIFPLVSGDAKQAPVVFLHPAGGLGWGYRTLAQKLSRVFPGPMFAIQSPMLTGAPMPETLAELCRHYADLIMAETPCQTIHLIGWSLGGILAQEIAVELLSQGRRPGVVALLDAYPAEAWRAEPQPDPVTALRALLAIAGHDPDAHPELDTRSKVVRFLKDNSRLLGALPRDVLDAVVELVSGTNLLMRKHTHRSYAGRLTHLRAGHDHAGRGFTPTLWQPHCAELASFDLPCLHKDMVSPAQAPAIAEILSGSESQTT
ncbi:non-ribosomal peptide synthetase [Paracoccus seriniphilus]|uniref:Enterobactin synthetase component F n=1 Tax=Paracoccus seriniphilus TaxID=184748 RepID=A0A239PRT1_9RHOB|nr:non-ribosomal peptide synthetase [Paracoccus seriniphilus]SNT72632.1 enterobactin synthetase component F [Paracoccus seriniphilus]